MADLPKRPTITINDGDNEEGVSNDDDETSNKSDVSNEDINYDYKLEHDLIDHDQDDKSTDIDESTLDDHD